MTVVTQDAKLGKIGEQNVEQLERLEHFYSIVRVLEKPEHTSIVMD